MGGPAPTIPSVVAFSDPNDLLSYPLARSPHRSKQDYPVIDVIASNAPTILGLVEMPTTAHLGYGNNGAVKKIIACGHPESKRCLR